MSLRRVRLLLIFLLLGRWCRRGGCSSVGWIETPQDG
jgi:hypothetical protein